MDAKLLGWIQIVGGVLAILFPGGGMNMIGMMSFGSYGMMSGGIAITIFAWLFIIMGIHHVSEKKGKKH